MNENSYKKKVKTILRSLGVWAYCPNESLQAGIPDILVCCNGKMIAIELKFRTSNKLDHVLSAVQNKTLRDIAKAGGKSYVLVGESSYAKSSIHDASLFEPGQIDNLEGTIEDTSEILRRICS